MCLASKNAHAYHTHVSKPYFIKGTSCMQTSEEKRPTAKQFLHQGLVCLSWHNCSNCSHALHPLFWIPTLYSLYPSPQGSSFPGGPGGRRRHQVYQVLSWSLACSCLLHPGLPRKARGQDCPTPDSSWMWWVSSGLCGGNSQCWATPVARSWVMTLNPASILHLLEEHLKGAKLEREVKEGGQVPRRLHLFPSSIFLSSFCFTATSHKGDMNIRIPF